MRTRRLERQQELDLPLSAVFAFFADAGNLQAITPPWLKFRILTPMPIIMGAGTRIEYAIRWRGIPFRWTTLIEEWTPPYGFVDRQLRGPYATWRHAHEFRPGARGVTMVDTVDYAAPAGAFGVVAEQLFVNRDVRSIFDYRAAVIPRLLSTSGAGAP